MKSTLIIGTVLVLSASLISCDNAQDNQNRESSAQTIDDDLSEKIIIDKYLKIKDALVQSDGDSASKVAKELVKSIAEYPGELIGKIRVDAQAISESKDVEIQRNHFNSLSENIYEWVKKTDPSSETLYRQYCPMAFSNSGAYWISSEKEIENPYFGDKMLHCGSVKEEL